MMTDERSLKLRVSLGYFFIHFTLGARHDDRREVIETQERCRRRRPQRDRRTT